jgi:hypothetical protein
MYSQDKKTLINQKQPKEEAGGTYMTKGSNISPLQYSDSSRQISQLRSFQNKGNRNSSVKKAAQGTANNNVIQRVGADLVGNGFSIHADHGAGLPKIYYKNIGTEHRYIAMRSTFHNTAGSPAGGVFGNAHAGLPYHNSYGEANDITGAPVTATAGSMMTNTSIVHAAGHMLPAQYGGQGTPANTFEQNFGENATNPWRGSENNAAAVWNGVGPGNPWVYYSLHL